ncbi:MAG: TlpA family protein disulfide reductase [Actinomycetota bacterium]
MSKRDRVRARAEAKRQAERRAQQRRTLGIALGGVALIAVVVVFVVVLMKDEGGNGAGPSTPGQVTVEGSPRTTPLEPGESVPSFTAPELSGGKVDWKDYAGQPVVLSVWAPWCPHCQAELPVVDRVMKDYAGVGWVTIVTSMGDQPGPTPEEYMLQNELDFATAVDDEAGTLAAAFGIQGFPTLYFVNSDGTVALELEGEVDEATLRSTIESLT